MIKELVAAAVLVLIAVAGILNNAYMDKHTNELIQDVETAQEIFHSGDFEASLRTVDAAQEKWRAAESYNHMMLRHDDVDNVSEAFFELRTALQAGNAVDSLFESLSERIEMAAEVQRPNIPSLF